jgi:hypothetical protein
MLTAETDHMSEREFSAMAEYVELARSTGGSMTIVRHRHQLPICRRL